MESEAIRLDSSVRHLSGCSQDTSIEQPSSPAARTVDSAGNKAEVPSAPGQKSQTARKPTSTTSESAVVDKGKRHSQEAQTSMNLTEGMKREFQNGPDQAEFEKYRQLVNKQLIPRSSPHSDRTSDPVFDSEMVKVGR